MRLSINSAFRHVITIAYTVITAEKMREICSGFTLVATAKMEDNDEVHSDDEVLKMAVATRVDFAPGPHWEKSVPRFLGFGQHSSLYALANFS